MAFEVFVPRRATPNVPRVAILPSGAFWISSGATKAYFEGFQRTFVLYEKKRNLIGFRPTNEPENSYALSRTKGRNDITLSGKDFSECLKISHKERKSYKATWNRKEKLVQIDLNEPL